MSFANSKRPQINLASGPYERPFFVDMEAFFEFSFWISEELLDLQARYTQKALQSKARTLAATPACTNGNSLQYGLQSLPNKRRGN